MLAMNDKVYTIRPNTKISYQSLLKKEAYYLLNFFKKQFHLELDLTDKDDADIRLFHKINGEQSDRNSPEAYELKIDEDGICIIGNDLPGTFYGIQSLIQLVLLDKNSSSEKTQVPFCQISDFPQFTYRGIHLDVARNFHNTETIKSLLDYLALYKLNKFHFHLTDDEGWRLEIRGLPELTKIGGRRGHDLSETKCLLPSLGSGFDHSDLLSSGNGYYSRNEFKELIKYANDRHIEVIPAIDLPGHARAAIRAMEVRYDRFIADGNPGKAKEFLLTEWADESDYESVQMWRRNVVNIGLSSTYRFIEKVVDEIIALYSEADVKLTTIHIGGDEVPEGSWSKSPECNNLIQESPELENTHDLTAYFLKRVNVILTSRGLNTAGWEEIVLYHNEDKVKPNEQLADLNLTAYTWNTMWGSGNEEFPYKLANMGYKIVLSNAPTLYFDMAYCKDPEEPGYYWAGYSETEDVFKFIPLNFYRSAKKDALGNIIHPETRYHKAEVLKEKGKENILGLQGQLWSENINSKERLEYQLFPRLCALAERGWSKTSELDSVIDKGWNEFSNRLGQIDLPRLDRLFSNINYRIPMPGVRIENDILKANVTLPGLTIRYTTDGSEPNENSEIYLAPIIINNPVIKLKTFATNNNYSRTTIIKTPVNEVKKLVS
jgi:hexosaminidase